uniref:Sugar phosphate transporter domain-containing protein n=1 Tax=Emiliania huxleyi TaxID=2903 RepID=A0A7S3SJ05_EMIHU
MYAAMAPEAGADGVQKKKERAATFVSSASPAAASDDPRAHADGHPGAAREIMAAGSSAVPPSKVGYLQMAPDSDTLPAAAQPDDPPQPDGESQVDPSSCHSSPAALGPAREGESPQASLAGPVRCSAGKRTAAQPLVTTAARSDRFNVGDGGSGVEIGLQFGAGPLCRRPPSPSSAEAGPSSLAAADTAAAVTEDSKGWLARSLGIAVAVVAWYGSSIGVTLMMKHLLSDVKLRAPFFLVGCTNVLVAAGALLLSRLPPLRPPPLPLSSFVRVALPIGLGSALDISFSNWSLAFVSVAYHVILKCTVPLFVLGFGILLRIERAQARTLLAVCLIVAGVSLASLEATEQEEAAEAAREGATFGGESGAGDENRRDENRPVGILLGLLSACFGGQRWAFTQILLRGGSDEAADAARLRRSRMGPVGTLLYTAPDP